MEKVDYPRNKDDEVIAIIHPKLQVNSKIGSTGAIFGSVSVLFLGNILNVANGFTECFRPSL